MKIGVANFCLYPKYPKLLKERTKPFIKYK